MTRPAARAHPRQRLRRARHAAGARHEPARLPAAPRDTIDAVHEDVPQGRAQVVVEPAVVRMPAVNARVAATDADVLDAAVVGPPRGADVARPRLALVGR